MKDITYIFTGGRNLKLKSNEIMASDFFYGFIEFQQKIDNANFFELGEENTKLIDKLIIKITKLPIYFFKALRTRNYKDIIKTKNIIFVNESSLFSFFPIFFLLRKNFRGKLHFIPMGLVDTFITGNFITRRIIKFCLSYIDNILFIGKGELENYHKHIGINSNNCQYIPFSIDVDFWKDKETKIRNIKNLLFIGNDRNRDYQLINELSESIQKYNLTVITTNEMYISKEKENIKHIKGSWRSGILTDVQILDEYKKADLVIIPLSETTQPSGQSVALQSMSSGTPVLITRTKGFWDEINFINKKNIFFVENNNPDTWIKFIDNIASDLPLLKNVSEDGKNVVNEIHNIKKFTEKLDIFLA